MFLLFCVIGSSRFQILIITMIRIRILVTTITNHNKNKNNIRIGGATRRRRTALGESARSSPFNEEEALAVAPPLSGLNPPLQSANPARSRRSPATPTARGQADEESKGERDQAVRFAESTGAVTFVLDMEKDKEISGFLPPPIKVGGASRRLAKRGLTDSPQPLTPTNGQERAHVPEDGLPRGGSGNLKPVFLMRAHSPKGEAAIDHTISPRVFTTIEPPASEPSIVKNEATGPTMQSNVPQVESQADIPGSAVPKITELFSLPKVGIDISTVLLDLRAHSFSDGGAFLCVKEKAGEKSSLSIVQLSTRKRSRYPFQAESSIVSPDATQPHIACYSLTGTEGTGGILQVRGYFFFCSFFCFCQVWSKLLLFFDFSISLETLNVSNLLSRSAGLQLRKEERSSQTTYQHSDVLLGLDINYRASNADAPGGFWMEHTWWCSTEAL